MAAGVVCDGFGIWRSNGSCPGLADRSVRVRWLCNMEIEVRYGSRIKMRAFHMESACNRRV